MGKYMEKSNKTADMSPMEDPHQQSALFLGIRTRAKTRALERLGLSPAESPAPESGDYMQLRNRRLKKLISSKGKKQKRGAAVVNPRSNSDSGEVKDGSVDSGSADGSGQLDDQIGEKEKDESVDLGIQASCDENVLDDEETENGDNGEATPRSLLRVPDAIRTPGSTTRPGNSTEDHGTVDNSRPGHIPMEHDMDEFFARAEEQQRKQFMEKYNFDPVSEKPLPGRYEWVKIDP